MDGQTDILPWHSPCYAYASRSENELLLFIRDIKPHNVMLDTGDEGAGDVPVLLDFGSMGEARVSITNISQARSLQVQLCQLN